MATRSAAYDELCIVSCGSVIGELVSAVAMPIQIHYGRTWSDLIEMQLWQRCLI